MQRAKRLVKYDGPLTDELPYLVICRASGANDRRQLLHQTPRAAAYHAEPEDSILVVLVIVTTLIPAPTKE